MDESQDDIYSLEQYVSYLRILARGAVGRRNRARIDESDIVQATLAQAWERRDQLRGTTRAEVQAWLRQILKSKILEAGRRNGREKRDPSREVRVDESFDNTSKRLGDLLTASGSTPSKKAMREERILWLAKVLEDLPEAQRDVILMRFFDGLSYDEIGAAIANTAEAAASLNARGLAELRARGALVERSGGI